MFYVTGLMLIIASLIYYIVDNIEETKALVPLVSVQNDIESITGNIVVVAKLENYGGLCTLNDECHPDINYYY